MKIKFVNHSSFIIEHEHVSIISDPWFEGKIFNNGWDLISKTKMSYDDFRHINYIWFSHEHPDHFYPPNLKSIPLEYKNNITVLFQNTIDGRVANFCRNAGFKEIIELHKGEHYNLSRDFKILCEHFDEGDSWISYKVGETNILNTNDCGIRNKEEADYIIKNVGEVDILLTQFSYAYWAGNREDYDYRKKIADDKLEAMRFQVEKFKPKVTIPIASYVYFCHEENFYLNDLVNTAEKAYFCLKSKTITTPVILYNGDEYSYPENWDSTKAIESYKSDFENAIAQPDKLVKNNPVTLDQLKKQVTVFIDNLNHNNGFLIKSVLRKTKIHISDYDKTYELSLKHYLVEKEIPYNECDISLSSESFLFCLKYPYGLDTTQINGRLQKPKNGRYSCFYNFFRIDQQKSRGQEMTLGYLLGTIVRKIKVKMSLLKE
jgi:hypothetical protein